MQQMRTATWPTKDGGSETFEMVDGVARDIIEGKEAMKNDMDMGGAKVTNLGNAVNDGDALALAFAKALFAPSGFGLGEHQCRSVDSWNDATKNGFYHAKGDSPDGNDWYGITISRDGSLQTQIAFLLWGYKTLWCVRKHNQGWQPWEWVNPPMELGVYYRTIELLDGKAIYKCRKSAGIMQYGTHKKVHFDCQIGALDRIAGCTGVIRKDVLPKETFNLPCGMASCGAVKMGGYEAITATVYAEREDVTGFEAFVEIAFTHVEG